MLLARGLMERQEWARAKPYAVAASDAWSGAALRCISNCLEGLGEHEESELWAQRLSESYPNSAGAAWYFWLQRNGKPMDGKARQLADHYFGNRNAPPGRHKRLVFTSSS